VSVTSFCCDAQAWHDPAKFSCLESCLTLLITHVYRLVTLAVQNSLLTLIMHYSRVSIPPSQSYSAPTAVLLNELLKGFISLAIAFARINRVTPYTSDTPQLPLTASRFWHPTKVLLRVRRLGREVFSPDCWKLSIPAILYGMYSAQCI
jgi:UDP-sugar transporter A1/2/3